MPELMGKLDTSVNGPEGLPRFDGDAWDCVDWRHQEEQVRRLRGRIFKGVQEGDCPLARNVQKLMLRSWANTLCRVRQVTQRNTGRRTAGIDGLVALTSLDDSRGGRGWLLIVSCRFSAGLCRPRISGGWRVLPDVLGAGTGSDRAGEPPFRVAGTGWLARRVRAGRTAAASR